MAKLHQVAHMDRNLVKKGDRVIQYVTPIGTIGNGNKWSAKKIWNKLNPWGKMLAHLHHAVGIDLTPAEMKAYVIGKGKTYVLENYEKPTCNYDRMFWKKMDVGGKGYAYGQKIQGVSNSYHPGEDVNGANVSGDEDFGWQFTAPCTGTVIHEERTWFSNGNWGNLAYILEDEDLDIECNHSCDKHCDQ